MPDSIVTGGNEFRVNSVTLGYQSLQAIAALDDGGFIVSWETIDQDGNGYGIYAQRFDSAGAPQGGEFLVNTTTAGSQATTAVAALDDGGFVISWSSFVAFDDGDIYLQRYDANGAAAGGELRVTPFDADTQGLSTIVGLQGGGFVVSWSSYDPESGDSDVYARRYDASGAPQGGQFRVNSTISDLQGDAAIAALDDGGFVIGWRSTGQDGSGNGIYAQRYDASGVAQGSEFRVNSHTAGDQNIPAIAALDGGGFVMSWQSDGQDGDGNGIYAQRFDAAGAPQGGEFRVNSYTADDQTFSSITALHGGGFVVAWQSAGQDGDDLGVFAQVYDANGVPDGDEFQINVTTDNSQAAVRIAALAEGGFIASWSGYDQNGSYDVYARTFSVNIAPVAVDDAVALSEDDTIDLWTQLLGNDTDANGDALTIISVETMGTDGNVAFDPATQTLTYSADTQYFDDLPPGIDVTDSFTYTVEDPSGATSTATVTLTVTTTFSGITFTGTEGDDLIKGGPDEDLLDGRGGNDTIVGFEEEDVLIGGSGNDVLSGGAGGDRLDGGDGSDTLIGGAGADVLDGGAGRDTASYRGALAGVKVSLNDPATNTGDAAGDSFVGIENLEGTAHDDVLMGDDGANDFFGGDGVDTVTYAWAATGVIASLGNITANPSPTTETGAAAGDRYDGIETLAGTNFGDRLYAANGGSTLIGLAGDDTLYGLGGTDALHGGAGQDALYGDGGQDFLYGGDDADTLRGDAGADYLFGESGGDTLDGGAGADILDGGAGNDIYTGGAGADLFAIRDPGDADTITDFKRGQGDKIDLSALGVDEWIGNQAFHGDAGEVRLRNVAADFFLEGDLDGDGVADFSIAVGHVQLVENDIVFA